MRKTKIICTLGPVTEGTDVLRQLIEKGADIFRLNMSHADHRSAREIVPRIRQLAEEIGRPVGVWSAPRGPPIGGGDLKPDHTLIPGMCWSSPLAARKARNPIQSM